MTRANGDVVNLYLDEEYFVEMLSMRLSDAGHRVRTAFDGDAALAAADAADRTQIDDMVLAFRGGGYRLRQVYADAAVYCMGE